MVASILDLLFPKQVITKFYSVKHKPLLRKEILENSSTLVRRVGIVFGSSVPSLCCSLSLLFNVVYSLRQLLRQPLDE